jgi:Spy/CpxP family protein refolding chaperone
MKQALDLSDSQESKMNGLRRDFYQDSSPVRQSLRNLKHDLALESVRKSPDRRKIAKLTQSIGQEHVRLAQIESRHLRDLSTVLDARQMDRLLQMKDHFGGRRWNRG